MRKKEIKKRIEQLLAGELNDTEVSQLRTELEAYPEYREIAELHAMLDRMENDAPEVSGEKFSRMRAEVLRAVRLRKNDTSSANQGSILEKIQLFLMRPEMAAAALTLIIGFFLGRVFPGSGDRLTGQFLSQINILASQNTQLNDVKNSPYTYSNISFREVDQNTVELSFDVSTHLNMVKTKNDPVVREVIAQALLNPSNVGSELKAISFSESIVDQRVKQALIFSMKNAPIVAVRQKAEETLLSYKEDPEIREAFLGVLREEESVQMRLTALEYLINNKIPPDSIRILVDRKHLQNSPAVLFRAKKYLENTF